MQEILNKTVQNYVLLDKIGQGQFGNVYRAQNKRNKQMYAVKAMNVSKFKQTPKLSEFTNNQISILSKINHPNIIRFIQMLRTANNYYLVYELCNGGTLSEYIRSKKCLPQSQALQIFSQIRNAFNILNQANILHRDLKPTNILFHNNIIKLADFGFCKQLLKDQDLTQTIVGSPIYMAPQVLKGQAYDNRADVWSMGVILYQMLYGMCPYEQCTIPRLISLLDSTPLRFNPKVSVSDHVKGYLKRILTLDPQKRISPNQFIAFPLKENKIQTKCLSYARKAIMCMIESIETLLEGNNVVITYLVFKIYMYFSREISINSMIWQHFQEEMPVQNTLKEIIKQEQSMMKPIGDKLKDILQKTDPILKIAIELNTQFINNKLFLEEVQLISKEDVKIKLYNCFLYYIQIIRIMEGKKNQLKDVCNEQHNLSFKRKQCQDMINFL